MSTSASSATVIPSTELTSKTAMPEPTIEDYTIGWICALQEEYEAACRMLDVEFDGPETSEVNDNNTYAFGCVSRHNVVIGCLPNGRYGTSSAARVARDMVRSFPNLRFALMVGIGGGAPTRERDIRLGDVVVSVPQDGLGGVVQYDFGKRLSDGRFQRTSQLNAPPEVLLGVIPEMQRRHNDPRKPDRISEHLKLMGDMPGYQRPPDDRLYRADYEHKGGKNCTSCKADGLEERLPRESSREVAIHHGIIASANSVMKNAKERDKYAQDPELNILCFEMEAGGLMNNFPCLVIRGICDYSDSHKNDDWHKYAALTAAAYARELLHILKPRRVTIMPSWVEKMEITLADIQGQVSATFRKTDQIIHRQRTQEHKEILNWLTEIDYGPQQSDYIGRRQARTGQWLLGSAEFQAWLQDSRQTLFCPGIPGAGKTMITSIVVDFLETNFPKGSNVGIVYFYCNFRRQHEQTLEHFRMSLLKQLLQGQPSMPDSMKQLHNHHKEKQTRPSSNEIFTVLQSVTTIYTRIFIIIDALDECAAGRCRNTLLSEIFNLQSKSAISIFATSRISDEISKSFDGALRLIIHATNEDLETYLKGRMVLQQPDIFDDNIQEMAVAGIIKAADGMFLLAELHMNTLLSLPTKGDIKQALRSLAKGVGGLDETYELAMQRIESQGEGYRKLAKQTLAWIVHAKRSLSTLELRHALAVRPCIKYFDGDYIPTATVVRSVCAGLVTVDEESNIIRLVHYTTQEYFEKTQGMWFPDAIADIAVICTTYLSYSIFESGVCRTNKEFKERLRSNQLYDYAARNWGHHAMEIADEKAQVKVLELILDLLSNEAMVSGCSQAMMASRIYGINEPTQMTGVHIAAYFGLKDAIIGLLEKGQAPDLTDRDGRTALSWAVENGHEAVVQLLLGKDGVKADSKDSGGRTPLSYAARNGHHAIVQLLLMYDIVKVDSKDEKERTPLLYAVKNGHEAVVKHLLDKGAEINSKAIRLVSSDRIQGHSTAFPRKESRDLVEKLDRTPLLWAAWNGHEAVVKHLLDRGAEIESKDAKYGRTPLSWTAENGHEAVVKHLLDRGAEIESEDVVYGRTPLLWAAGNGHEAVVKHLLDRGAEIESEDAKYGRTPLSWAAGNGHEAVVKHLLDRDAETESKDVIYGRTPLLYTEKNGHEAVVQNKNRRTPLSYAAANGHKTIVELLLAKDRVNVNSKDLHGRTPLLYAARNGQEAVVQLLLMMKDEVDADSKDLGGRTPLSYAAEKGREAVVQLLLVEDKVNAESKDSYERTPLSYAAEDGREAVVQQLLAQDIVNVNSKDVYGQTPLLFAAEKGQEAVVLLLLANDGVDVNARSTLRGETPLSGAIRNGCEEVVRLLLATDGVDMESKDNDGRTPLSRAARNRNKAVVKLLLTKYGVDPYMADSSGQILFSWTMQQHLSPIFWAVKKGHEATVQLLLANNGVDVNVKDKFGWTPLSWAALKGHKGVIRLLLASHRVDVDATYLYGRTLLLWAAEKNREMVVQLLLEKDGVNVNVMDDKGRTPLSLAAENGHEAVVQLLLAKDGVDVNSKDGHGRTPLSWAAERGHKAVVKHLLKKGGKTE